MLSSVVSRLQDRRDTAADLGEDAGFTLIELMVVLLILAILLAIAIPTFLGVTGGANDRAAQSNLNTALTSLKTAATQGGQSYGGGTNYILASTMKTNEPSLNWLQSATAVQTGGAAVSAPATAATATNTVSYYVSADGNGVVVADWSKNANTCWYIVDNLSAVTDTTAGGVYGAAAVPAGNATTAPSAAGTFYAKAAVNVTTTPNGCDPAKATVGVGVVSGGALWSANFTAAGV